MPPKPARSALTSSQKVCLLEIVAMPSASPTINPSDFGRSRGPVDSSRVSQYNRENCLKKPETRPDPFFRTPSETPRTAKSYKVCPSTLKKLQNSINMHSNDNYSLLNVFGNNCTGWACNRLSDAGLNPPVSNIWGLYPGNNFGQSPATKPMFYGK